MRWLLIRLRLRTLLAVVACVALGLWVAVPYLSPAHRWHRAIRTDDESAARWRAASLGVAGRVAGVGQDEAIRALSEALYDPSYRVRETAAATLSAAGPKARSTVPHLVLALKDVDPTVRLRAAQSLGDVVGRGDDDARRIAAPALVAALNDTSPDVRMAAAFSLVLMDRCEAAIPVMSAALREGRDRTGYAELGLGLCGSRDGEVVENLKLVARRSYDVRIRRLATEALARLAASGRDVNPVSKALPRPVPIHATPRSH